MGSWLVKDDVGHDVRKEPHHLRGCPKVPGLSGHVHEDQSEREPRLQRPSIMPRNLSGTPRAPGSGPSLITAQPKYRSPLSLASESLDLISGYNPANALDPKSLLFVLEVIHLA